MFKKWLKRIGKKILQLIALDIVTSPNSQSKSQSEVSPEGPQMDSKKAPPTNVQSTEPFKEPLPKKERRRFTWVLDNGHGKLSKEMTAPEPIDGKLFKEYEFNQDIVKRIHEKLKPFDVDTHILIPDIEEVGNCLKKRVKLANNLVNNHPKILLSVHSNNYGKGKSWKSPKGFEIWHQDRNAQSFGLAALFSRVFVEQNIPFKFRGLKHRVGKREFYLFKNCKMPCILTENGFYTNKEECKLLMKDEIREKIALVHVESILRVENIIQ